MTNPTQTTTSNPGRYPSALQRALWVLGAVACVVAIFALHRLALQTATGQRLDEDAMRALTLGEGSAASWVRRALTLTVPVSLAALSIAALVSIAQRRFAVLAQMLIVFTGVNVSAQLLKHVIIDRPALIDNVVAYGNSFPSGHAAMAAASAGALYLAVTGTRFGPAVAALASAWAALIGLGTVMSAWHRPSDVAASFLIVIAWVFAVRAFTPQRRPAQRYAYGGGSPQRPQS